MRESTRTYKQDMHKYPALHGVAAVKEVVPQAKLK
jgi:hypothetical protein